MRFRFAVTEHDPAKPWLILSTRTGLSLEARDGHEFWEKVALEWPRERFVVELEPGELMKAVRSC